MITTWAQRRNNLAERLLVRPPVDRSSWQSGAAPSPVYELDDVVLCGRVNPSPTEWQTSTGADIPWAETHFQERVSGQPLNPAPSYIDWPWHSEKYKEEYKGVGWKNRYNRQSPFDHTYPERMWPKEARPDFYGAIMHGIRFDYGDLQDVVNLLVKDPFTRQAYLPIWFPEDTGSTAGQRVPCTLGYHFIRKGAHLDMKYFIRSCDITRHFHNDVYMAGRLLHWVAAAVQDEGDTYGAPYVGNLTMFISNLHMFTADAWRYNQDGSPKQ
ncbi:thymidylate synthase [Gordonia phage Mayweather]|uniref:Thymidylate synthase n=1 Tax=Gordonia phage Mayweather TaxID=2590931 RepID=A0A516KU63_9CAUD|nr:thymidylate synthase [Gordonia phage Mayweather]QDP45214.1 thymidylate synthase [Gordonia phage Mayweather]